MDIFIDQYRHTGSGGDPYASYVRFLLLGEGPSDGTIVNPVTGTILRDEVPMTNANLGESPHNIGSTITASTTGHPFGDSWIRMPGGDTSDNFIAVPGGHNYHPAARPFCYDCWYQLDTLAVNQALAGDESSFSAIYWNWLLLWWFDGLQFLIKTNAGTYWLSCAIGSTGISAGTPFHVEVSGDGAGNLYMFINGVLKATGTAPASTEYGPSLASSLLIGCQNPNYLSNRKTMTGYVKCSRFTEYLRHTTDFTPPSTLAEYAL